VQQVIEEPCHQELASIAEAFVVGVHPSGSEQEGCKAELLGFRYPFLFKLFLFKLIT
jgi:hypothetical protein